jgi:hypothetical protein
MAARPQRLLICKCSEYPVMRNVFSQKKEGPKQGCEFVSCQQCKCFVWLSELHDDGTYTKEPFGGADGPKAAAGAKRAASEMSDLAQIVETQKRINEKLDLLLQRQT